MATSERFDIILQRSQTKFVARRMVKQSDEVSLPVKGGRVSVPESYGTLGGFLAEMSMVRPDFNAQILDALENLAKYHEDVSYAVDNIVQLGNTFGSFPSKVWFDDKVPDNMAKEMVARLKERSKNWYAFSGGLNSMTNDFFSQLAITGALSAEAVPTEALDGVKKVVVVPPKQIRFQYDKDKDEYKPHQIVPNAMLVAGLESQSVELNTVTYSYIALRRFGEKPYAIPPFMSALDSVVIGRDMKQNLAHIVKKLGILGFLEVLVNGPKPMQGETDEKYYKRTEQYLDKVVPEIEKGLGEGYVTGFKGLHEFKMHSTTGNVTGARDLMDANDVKMMAGLKQDPLMFGRNFSTTETLGRVILAKMTSQVGSYQHTVSTFLEKLFLLDLQLAGYPVKNVEVEFDPPMVGDKKRDEEAKQLKIQNLEALYQQGVISQQQRAVELEYEKPDQPEPRNSGAFNPMGGGVPPESDNKRTDPNEDSDATDEKTTGANIKFGLGSIGIKYLIDAERVRLGGNYPEYPYHSDCCKHGHTDSLANFAKRGEGSDKLDYFISVYYVHTKGVYDKAVNRMSAKVAERLAAFGEGASVDEVTDAVIHTLYKDWGTVFSAPQRKVVSNFVQEAYTFFRRDASGLKGMDDIPKATFSTVDVRAMEYYKNSDNLYMGKFITDEDLRKQMSRFIRDEYLSRNLPIGDNKKSLEAFKAKFGDILQGQDWKLVRIINTTVNKMRNTASAAYMQQAEVVEYEVVGVNDRLQCSYCSSLQGKRFSVDKTMDHINNMSNSEPSLVGMDSPFVNSVFKDPEEVKNLSGTELQQRGIYNPPFHANCRDRIVAVL